MAMKLLVLSVLVFLSALAQWPSQLDNYYHAQRLRSIVEVKPSPRLRETGPIQFLLPVTRGFHQQGSQLCWAYATLNALETMNLVHNPKYPLEYSRAYMQHATWQDRIERRLDQPTAALTDRGTAINAILLIKERGISQFKDLNDISTVYVPDWNSILKKTEPLPTRPQKIQSVRNDLRTQYGNLPTTSVVYGKTVSTRALGSYAIGTKPWLSYAVASAKNPAGTFGPDPDPDTRGDYTVLFTTLQDIQKKIYLALKQNVPVLYSNYGHMVLIYGADYDQHGLPLKYYIKDSYPDYFYQADPEKLHRELLEIITLKQ